MIPHEEVIEMLQELLEASTDMTRQAELFAKACQKAYNKGFEEGVEHGFDMHNPNNEDW